MNQSKFSLADLLTVLAAIIFGFVSFLGFNFAFLGADKYKSIMYAALIAIGMGGLALAAAMLKRTRMISKTKVIMEFVLLFIFVLSAAFAMIPFSHYFTVSDKKDDIKSVVNDTIIKNGINMFDKYEKYANERRFAYESSMETAYKNRMSNSNKYFCYFDDPGKKASETEIDNQKLKNLEKLDENLNVASNNDKINILNNSKESINSWKPISVADVVNNLEDNLTKWKNELVSQSEKRAPGEDVDEEYKVENFECNIDFTDAKKMMTEWNPKFSILSFILALVLYVVMWLSYIITKRDSRWPGFSIVFGGGRKLDNEL